MSNPRKNIVRKILSKLFRRSKGQNVVSTGRPNVKGYPHLGSLDANFQDYAKKNLLNLEGFGIQTTPREVIKKIKTKNPNQNVKQLDLFKDKKYGGCIGPNGIL
jgi:hypothetical protein